MFDIREAAEYEVSHIKLAIHLAPSFSPELINETLVKAKYQPGNKIICYCSVGYRSSEAVSVITNNSKIFVQPEDVFNLGIFYFLLEMILFSNLFIVYVNTI